MTGTFDSDTGGTFDSDTDGTFNPLLSYGNLGKSCRPSILPSDGCIIYNSRNFASLICLNWSAGLIILSTIGNKSDKIGTNQTELGLIADKLFEANYLMLIFALLFASLLVTSSFPYIDSPRPFTTTLSAGTPAETNCCITELALSVERIILCSLVPRSQV